MLGVILTADLYRLFQSEMKSSVTEATDTSKNIAKEIGSMTPPAENAPTTPTPPLDMDKDESMTVVGSVLSSVLSAVANVDNQIPPPPPPSPPRAVTPQPKMEPKKAPEVASPPISKKKVRVDGVFFIRLKSIIAFFGWNLDV